MYILSYSILSSLSGHIIHPPINPSTLGNTFVMMMTPKNIVVFLFLFLFLKKIGAGFPPQAMESSSKVGKKHLQFDPSFKTVQISLVRRRSEF
jgi:hypothetical protein